MTFSFQRLATLVLGVVVVLASAFSGALPAQAAATSYYVDCSQATNGIGTSVSPWNSINAVNTHGAFIAGDTVYFNQGTSCSGMLMPSGSGTSSAPITLDSYATNSNHTRPIIQGGTNVAALELSNQQYWTVQNLEITGGAYRNVWVTGNTANTTLRGFIFNNLYVHDTANYTTGTWYTDAGGIILNPCNSTTTLSDIEINNVTVHHTFNQGIQVGHDSSHAQISSCTTPDYAGSVSNVMIENVTGDANGATAIAIYWSKNVTVQNSKLFNNGANGIHGEGSWSYHCDGCIWQHNEAYANNLGDGGGFDMDGETTNSIVQYNYVHDNQGYCASIFAVGGTGHINNSNNTIRYNVCAHNDTGAAIASYGYDSGEIFVSNFVDSGPGITGNQISGFAVYNNTIYAAPAVTGLPAISLQTYANVPLFTGSAPVYARNNIIYSDTPLIVGTDNASMSFDYNRYYYTGGSPQFAYNSSTNHTVNYTTFAGYQAGTGQDVHTVIGDSLENLPTYHANGISPTAGTLQSGSNSFGAGNLISGNGGQDAFYNSVSSSVAPNIGAYNGQATTGVAPVTGVHGIVNKYSMLALGANGSTANGTLLSQYTPSGANDQKWTITAVGDYYKIVNDLSGLAVDDYQWSSQSGTPVDQWSYSGQTNQLWSIIPIGSGNYRIVNLATGMSLDDSAYGTTNGSPVVQWPFHGTTNEFWSFS